MLRNYSERSFGSFQSFHIVLLLITIIMKQYCISYITNGGLTVLNSIVDADNMQEAITDVKGTEGVRMILSVVPIKK